MGAVFLVGRRWYVGTSAILGFLWVALTAFLFFTPFPPFLEGKDLFVEGEIEGLPVRFERGWRFNFLVSRPLGNFELPSKLRLSWYNTKIKLQAGESWRLQVRLKRPHGFRNPGGFDYERWLYAHRIGATGYVRNSGHNQKLQPGGPLDQWRQTLADRLDALLQDSPVHVLIKALVVGDKSSISRAQWQILRTTGTAHLMAISGLHISLIAGMAYGLSRRIWLRWGDIGMPADRIAAISAMMTATLYAALAGFSIPTQRALIMVGVALAALVLRRTLHPFHAVFIALFAVCVYDPWAPLSMGFWLSFSAVFLIFYGLAGRLRRPGLVTGFIQVQWVMWLGLMPLVLIFFSQVSWSAPIANSIAVPVVAIIVLPLSLLGSALMLWFPLLGQKFLQMADWVLSRLWHWLAWISDYSQFNWPGIFPETWVMIFAVPAILLILAPRGMPGRWLGGVMMLPLLGISPFRPAPGEAWLTLLDVGQGLAAVIQTRNHVLLYDAGPHYSERLDAGRDIIIPYLRRQGRTRLDLVIISHGDNDHRGGLAGVMAHFPSETITSDPSVLEIPAKPCQAGRKWRWDGVQFAILWPKESGQLSENNRSCVLKVTAAIGSFLLPGDLESAGENALLSTVKDQLNATVLIAPHHGSITSSTPEFLQAVHPHWILISSGYRNRFGFPHPNIIKRYRKSGAKICNTAFSGAITVQLKPNGQVKVTHARAHDFSFWRIHPPEKCQIPTSG